MFAFLDQNGRIVAVYSTLEHAEQQIRELGLVGMLCPVEPGADPAKLVVRTKITLEKFEGDSGPLLETIELESVEPMFG